MSWPNVALVTGGTSGIGAAITRRLAASGVDIAAGFWGYEDRAQDYLAQMRHDFPDVRVTLYEADVSDADACRGLIADVIEDHGTLDVLVNNAGITKDRTIGRMTDADWKAVLEVNLSSAFYLSQAAVAHMIERGRGRIVSISSVIGEIGNIGQVNYSAAKAGLFGLTKSLAREAAFALQRADRLQTWPGITVNAVAPGFVNTEMVATVPEHVLDGIRSRIPLARLAEPAEVASVVAFLASAEASYVTGQVIGVNGGLDM